MESKNDWYLISVSRSDFKQNGVIYMIAYYTNGLIERQKSIKMGEFIPTIIEHEQGTTIF